MASTREFVDFICEQADFASRLTYKRMFGEYALYLDEKVVAFVCDNQLFIKPTEVARQMLGKVIEAPPYPGAKLYFQVNE
jgi:TfoX/Sxy family transcriptional regulator of competence genes